MEDEMRKITLADVMTDICRRPGFPAVRVVFPGHVGPSYTASVPSQLDLSIMTV